MQRRCRCSFAHGKVDGVDHVKQGADTVGLRGQRVVYDHKTAMAAGKRSKHHVRFDPSAARCMSGGSATADVLRMHDWAVSELTALVHTAAQACLSLLQGCA